MNKIHDRISFHQIDIIAADVFARKFPLRKSLYSITRIRQVGVLFCQKKKKKPRIYERDEREPDGNEFSRLTCTTIRCDNEISTMPLQPPTMARVLLHQVYTQCTHVFLLYMYKHATVFCRFGNVRFLMNVDDVQTL